MDAAPCAILDILWIEGEFEQTVSVGSLSARRSLPRAGAILMSPPDAGWDEERQEFDIDAYEEETVPYFFSDRETFRAAHRQVRTALRCLGWTYRWMADDMAENSPISECCGPFGRRLPA